MSECMESSDNRVFAKRACYYETRLPVEIVFLRIFRTIQCRQSEVQKMKTNMRKRYDAKKENEQERKRFHRETRASTSPYRNNTDV